MVNEEMKRSAEKNKPNFKEPLYSDDPLSYQAVVFMGSEKHNHKERCENAIAPPEYEILLALRSSRARVKILEILANFDSPLYQSEIARRTGLSVGDVIGAIRGNGDRYKESFSLLALGLIEEIKSERGEHVRIYVASARGIEFFRRLQASSNHGGASIL
jgi:predicted transcriptional regulator with HTH domain